MDQLDKNTLAFFEKTAHKMTPLGDYKYLMQPASTN
jgi:hypothetical protein